jgi:selenocysteine lyase/cysteine desulfurase
VTGPRGDLLRLSFHYYYYYNNDEDVITVCAAIREYRQLV